MLLPKESSVHHRMARRGAARRGQDIIQKFQNISSERGPMFSHGSNPL